MPSCVPADWGAVDTSDEHSDVGGTAAALWHTPLINDINDGARALLLLLGIGIDGVSFAKSQPNNEASRRN